MRPHSQRVDCSEETRSALRGVAAETALGHHLGQGRGGKGDTCPSCFVLCYLGSFSSLLITFKTSRPCAPGPTHSSSSWPAASRTERESRHRLTPPRAGQPGPAPPAGAATPLPDCLLLSWLLSLVWSAAALLLLLSVPCPGLPEAACQSDCMSGLCPGH